MQDVISDVEDGFVSGPYYVFFCKWSEEEQFINPMKLTTNYSLWLQDHYYIRGPIAFIRASQTKTPAPETFGQSVRSTTKTYHFKDIRDMSRTKGNAKLNEIISKRPNHP